MTELSFAYGPLGSPEPSLFEEAAPLAAPSAPPPAPKVQSKQMQAPPPVQFQQQQPIQPYDQEQKLMNILTEIKKQQKTQQESSPSYVDKLMSKRKELWKALQICFIIILALSLHFFIDHYLRQYINNNDLSFEREVFVRLLYPLAILFLLWNLKTFVK